MNAAHNVGLWIANDEGLYRLALNCIKHARNRDLAARTMFETLQELGLDATPDGTRYSVSTIRKAMVGL